MQTCVRLLWQGDVQPYLHHHAAGAGSVGPGLREPGHRPLPDQLQQVVRGPLGSHESLIATWPGTPLLAMRASHYFEVYLPVPAANMMEVCMLECMVIYFPFLSQSFISVTHHWLCIHAWINNGGTCTVTCYTMSYYYRYQ